MNLKNNTLISFNDAHLKASELRKNGQSIVFTNGCFDIIHAGHIYYLSQAKKHGSLLWIGLNSNSSVKALKGPSRPIHNEESRAYVLSALTIVDFVTIFNEETPIALIEQIKPDVHVKGGDYKKENLPEYPIIKAYGGNVIIEEFLPGFSTSLVIAKGET